MKEVKDYIETGILELYVLGDLSPEERASVDAMALKYPEINEELNKIERGLEGYTAAYAIEPPDHLRDKILNNMLTSPAIAETVKASEAKIITIHSNKYSSFYKYAFAACLALLILSLVALFTTYNQLQNSQQQIAVLQSSNQQYSNRVNYMNNALQESHQALDVLRNPEVKMVKLSGTKQAPQASMMVAFNPLKKEVMIDMKAMKMPPNDTDHQYQLWALVDGKPVDLGVFDMSADEDGMKKMKAIGTAQAFAVTLEPRGGSQNPTMEQMMVMGSI